MEGRSPPDCSVIPNDRATVKVGVGSQPFPLPTAVAYAKFTPMSVPTAPSSRIRWSRPETSRLVLALVISLALHLTSYGVYEGGKALHDPLLREIQTEFFGWPLIHYRRATRKNPTGRNCESLVLPLIWRNAQK